jgi:hypothetical protein
VAQVLAESKKYHHITNRFCVAADGEFNAVDKGKQGLRNGSICNHAKNIKIHF